MDVGRHKHRGENCVCVRVCIPCMSVCMYPCMSLCVCVCAPHSTISKFNPKTLVVL